MVDLLQLPQGVGVEVSGPGEQEKLAPDLGRFDLASQGSRAGRARRQTGTTSTTSGISSRKRFSIPILSVIVEEGQPEHEPRMCRYATPFSNRSRVMSPPSCITAGRISKSR